jgi:hypothetical protein
MIIEARLCGFGELKICVKVGTETRSINGVFVAYCSAYLNSFSSSMTCMPCSYCSFVGELPDAKWLFKLITAGDVGNREAADGLLWPFVLDAVEDMMGGKQKRLLAASLTWVVSVSLVHG